MRYFRFIVYAVIAAAGIARAYDVVQERELAAQPQPVLCILPPGGNGVPNSAAVRLTAQATPASHPALPER